MKLKKICTICKQKGTEIVKLEFHLCDKHSILDFYNAMSNKEIAIKKAREDEREGIKDFMAHELSYEDFKPFIHALQRYRELIYKKLKERKNE